MPILSSSTKLEDRWEWQFNVLRISFIWVEFDVLCNKIGDYVDLKLGSWLKLNFFYACIYAYILLFT